MEAKDWAIETWKKAEENWINRIQDNNYRKYLVRPALEKGLSGIFVNEGVFVDIGCGEGKETHFLKKMLEKKGFKIFYGFDTNEKFINHAQKSVEGIVFDAEDFFKLKNKYHLEGSSDLVTSLFVLQDTPFVKDFVENTYETLKNDGIFLALIVHPWFAEILLKKGALKINDKLKKTKENNYVFVGKYPITESKKPPFYVPYFHRNLSDYIKLFEMYFHIESVKGLKPSNKLLEKSKKEKISPFYEEDYNVYWEEISKVPSSIIIKGIKKQ